MDIAALILSVGALAISVYNLIEYRSDKKSTHNIQFVPAESLAAPEIPNLSDLSEAPKGKQKKAQGFLSLMPEDELDV